MERLQRTVRDLAKLYRLKVNKLRNTDCGERLK
jgi:hypothetical protein